MNQDDCSITQSHAYSYQIKCKQLVIDKKNQAPSSYIKSIKHLNLKSKQTQKIQLTLALLQPWNHKPLLDDCQCEQKQKPINLKSSKAYNIQQNHENIKNRSQIFFYLVPSQGPQWIVSQNHNLPRLGVNHRAPSDQR